MDTPDQQDRQLAALARRRVLEAIRARLEAIGNTLSDSKIDAMQLRQNASELNAVVHRIEWLVDVSTPKAPPETSTDGIHHAVT